MKLVKYNDLETQFPSTFTGMLDRFFHDSIGASLKQFSPAVDISEDDKGYEIQVAVPGIKKEDFNIDLVNGKLTISGERKMEEKKEGKNFHSVETQYGSFRRSFFIPEDVIEEQVEAAYQEGLLKISLPKREKKVSKSTIKVN
jgi:HSP20 family protein